MDALVVLGNVGDTMGQARAHLKLMANEFPTDNSGMLVPGSKYVGFVDSNYLPRTLFLD